MKELMKKVRKYLKRGIENGDITVDEMENMQKDGAIIIDVRSPQEYEEGHIDGAILIPEYEIDKKALDKFDVTKTIIVYCSSGKKNKKAKKKLEKLGYKTVYNLKDGWFV